MRIWRIVSIGSATFVLALLPYRFALADNTNQTPPSPTQPSQGQAASHLNLYNFMLPRLEDKPFGNAAHGNGESGLQQNKPAEQNSPGTGLHWTTVDSHPGVGYQVDKNQDVRVHFGGHGAIASFALHF